ncbi:MAG: DotU family type IV/VI secretion system protein [Opitutaceae bacterium]|jgi:type IV/VI secretion system ImpK/VasF family protein|nr:DotU family type IV/VI secretion system protein [Opitutaceae bacterium]
MPPAAATAPKLPALCEPLFQEICRLNRLGRKAPSGEFAITAAEIKAIFAKMAELAKTDARLLQNYEKVELALIFFVDSMISDSRLPYANEWNNNRLAYERNELAGDEKFFDLLDETLDDNRDDAAERLVIFYTCLGLGFTGWYQGQTEHLRKKMKEIQPRIRAFLDTDETGLICPESYRHTNTANLPLPMGSVLAPMLITAACLIIMVIAANIVLFKTSSSELNDAIDTIRAHQAAAPKPDAGETAATTGR